VPTTFIDVVESTCFGHFLHMPRIKFPFHLFDQLFYCYCGGSCFRIHNVTLEFKVEDVAQILDLLMGPRKFLSFWKCGRVRYNVETQYFPSKGFVIPILVAKNLSKLLNQAKINDECILDCVRMWVVYIFANFLALDVR